MVDALAPGARRLGVASSTVVAALSLAYVCVLSVGLSMLPSPDHQIPQPWFALMEILIIGIAPAMVALTVALHAWVPSGRKAFAIADVVFMSMSAVVTCAVHFAILTLGGHPAFAGGRGTHGRRRRQADRSRVDRDGRRRDGRRSAIARGLRLDREQHLGRVAFSAQD